MIFLRAWLDFWLKVSKDVADSLRDIVKSIYRYFIGEGVQASGMEPLYDIITPHTDSFSTHLFHELP